MISKKDMHAYKETQRILLKTSDFICLRPHPSLSEYVSNYNITFPSSGLFVSGFTIMPSGCATLTMENDGKSLYTYLDGPTIMPYTVDSHANQLELIITIEFKPAGLYTFTGINQSELTGKSIPLDAIDIKLNESLSQALEKSSSISELAAALDMLLLRSINAQYHPQLGLIFHTIVQSGGNAIIKDLSSSIHYSERQLARIFKQHVGISAKSYARLIRINHAFRLLRKPRNSLTYVSDTTGFHDLSHFIRDFKLVCGVWPQEYRDNMSVFYNNTTRI
ncbi:MAG: helix-turn-helix transcriptional regulator [Defluviitaleaceae bacterium]|nr:helix-turn-helix transcriptional regulator [Defluviitaleaceae bacterium]